MTKKNIFIFLILSDDKNILQRLVVMIQETNCNNSYIPNLSSNSLLIIIRVLEIMEEI